MNAGAARAETPGKQRRALRLLAAGGLLAVLAAIAISAGCVSRRMGALPGAEEYRTWESLPNFSGETFQNLEPSPMNLKAMKKKSGMWRFLFHSVNAPRTFRIPQKPWDPELFAGKAAGFSVYWLGHSSLIFELDGVRFMTDPVFGNASPVPFTVKRYCEPPMKREDIPPLDFLIISHDHYDHLEYDTIRALSEAAGFPVEEVPALRDAAGKSYLLIGGELAEISYSVSGNRYYYRVSPGSGDNSGNYNDYPTVETAELEGVSVTFKGEGGACRLALWEANGFACSLACDQGVPQQDLEALVRSVIRP